MQWAAADDIDLHSLMPSDSTSAPVPEVVNNVGNPAQQDMDNMASKMGERVEASASESDPPLCLSQLSFLEPITVG